MATQPRIRYDIEARATGRAEIEALAAELRQLDDAFDPALGQRAEALGRELQDLGEQRQAIESFSALKRASSEASAELQQAQAQAQAFGAEIAKTANPTRAQQGQLERLRDAVRGAKAAYQESLSALDQSRAGLTRLGVASDQVATRSTALRARLSEVGQEIRQLATGAAAQAAQRLEQQAQATDTAAAAAERAQQALRDFGRAAADGSTALRGTAADIGATSAGLREFLAATGAAGQGAEAQAARLRELSAAAQAGAADTRALATQFEQLDNAFDPTVAERARALAVQLRALADQQGVIQSFRALKVETTAAAGNLDRLQAETQAYASSLSAVQQPTQAQVALLERMRGALREAQLALDAKRGSLDAVRAKLGELGVPTQQLAQAQTSLGVAVRGAREELQQLSASNAALNGLQQLAAATERADTEARAAEAALAALRSEIAAAGTPTTAQAARLAELSSQAQRTATTARQAAAAQADAAVAARAAGAGYDAIAAAQGRANTTAAATVAAGQRVAASYREQGAAAQASAAQQVSAANSVRAGLDGVGAQLRGLQNLAGIAIGGTIFTQLIGEVAQTADAYTNLAARIKLVTGEGAAFTDAFEQVFEVAKATNSSLEGTGTLFARIAQAGKEIGVSQREALSLTQTINQAIQLSGGSAQAADAAITQLIQGLQSGVLRGEEFNSVLEQAPRLALALSNGLGVTTGELRKLAEQGKLTTEVVIQALQGQADTLRKEFETLPATVGRAIQNLSTEWTRYVGTVDQANGASAQAAAALDALANNIGPVVDTLFALGKAWAALQAFGIAKTFFEWATAARAGTAATAAATTAVAANTVATGINSTAQTANTVARGANATAAGVQATALAASSLAFGRAATATTALTTATTAASVGFRAFGIGLGPIAVGVAALLPEIQRLGVYIGETAAKWTVAGKEAADFAARQKEAGSAALAVAQQQADATRQFSAVAIKSGEEVLRLTEQQREAYERQLEGRRAYQTALFDIAAAEQKLGRDTVEAQKAAELAVRQTALALNDLRDGVTQTGDGIEQGLSPKAQALIADFDELRSKGTSAAESIASIGRDFDPSSQEGLRVMGEVLAQLEADGKVTAEQVRSIFADAIAEEDILAFETRAKAAFAGIRGEAKVTEQAVDAGLRQAVKRTGTDFEQLTTGVSSGARRAIADFDFLRDRVDAIGVTSKESGDALARALDKSIEASTTEKALEQVRQRTEELKNEGILVGDAYEEAAGKIQRKLDDLKPGITSVGEAWRTLGLEVKASADKQAEDAIAAYERIKASGTGTPRDVQDAFVEMASRVVEASGGIVSEWLQAEAAARGLTVSIDEFGRVSIDAFDGAIKGAISLGDAVGQVEERLKAAGERFEKFKRSSLTYDDQGFATGSDGQRIGIDQQVDIPDGGSFDSAAFLRESQEAARSRSTPPDPERFVRASDTPGDGASVPTWALWMQRQAAQQNRTLTPAPAPRPVQPTTPPPPATGREQSSQATGSAAPAPEAPRRVEVTLNVGGQRSTGLFAEDDADRLLRALESAQRSSGIGGAYQ